ncbi:SusC/RagA family TonB-linked outer membrane protein [Dinghuibacter silviterrae]|uniref:TonB-linked SusC/RagA family outer membrane protein n=1 Tax=Dinghuibacter silviterrae TaxID=1539049 RepID=A0A4R8DHY2_9BACT|nr:TonB-dependent receptor [Dinghuibacter silviterrae]TDW96874.1 TonB-linked SusC/RagA family outer membrane protein [Dinghuibacter silviterrae]
MPKPFKLLAFLVCIFLGLRAEAQRITITGTIRDTAGALVRGANVTVRGNARIGTVSDDNGRFILDVPENSIIEFSSINFETLALPARANMSVIMHLSKNNLSDVVVTAYGKKQRREAVVGSVTSVNPEDLRIPASNLTNALAGQIAGVIAFQRSGQPGADNAQFFIRGVTTLGYSASPLILVDNVELTANDLARLNVDDIASFSILKDASAAALYGARGANGVILVTTKEGKTGKAKVNFRYEHSVSKPTKTVQLADPITYMKDYNEAVTTRDPLATPYFTPNQIQNATATWNHAPGSNPYLYPAVDWMNMLFRKQTTTQRANFSVQGGSEQAKYYISGSYDRDNGILQISPVNNFNSGMKFENYQLRSNVNVKVTKTTEAVVRLWGNFNDYTGPITSDQSGLATDLYDRVLHTSPVSFPAFYAPDSANLLTKHILFGNNTSQTGSLQDNPYADLMYGYKNFSESRMSAQFELNQTFNFITRGLAFHGIFSTNRYSYFDQQRSYKPFYYDVASVNQSTGQYTLNWINNQPGAAQEFLSYYPGSKIISTYIYMQGSIDYDRSFGDHHVSGTVLGTREQTVTPNANDPITNQPSLAASLPARNLGLSGRASYSFKDRYFLEFNFGYNGSEKFAPNHRFGFFPTIGAGYVISNESYWKGGISRLITRLKVRGSYGLVGNDNIGQQRFFYLSSVTPDGGPGATFGSTNGFSLNGTTIQAYPNPDVTWETARKSNVALEIEVLKNFNLIAEFYHEYRYNILIPRGYIPVETGIENSAAANLQANLGTAYSNGIDLHLDYKQRFSKDLQVTVMANFTGTSNKVGHLEEPQYPYPYLFHSGQPINEQFGYIAERLFVDDKEAANSPSQLFGGNPPQGGDIKYRDINKDGVINSYDQVPLGLPTTPEIIYGFGFSAQYKQFDLSAFFQGDARVSFFINPTAQNNAYYGQYGTAPFANNAQLLKAYADDHWTEENQNLYALWPRLSTYENNNNEQTSSWWLRNGNFMRLKSLEVGYSLPRAWSRRIFLDNARIYFNGLNLLTWAPFKLWDPEQSGQGFSYPIQKVLNVGVNLNF